MSYPKQQGVIPDYTGPPPIDLTVPETLIDALKQGNNERVNHYISNPTCPDELNKCGFNNQRPLHLVCFRGDHVIAKRLLDNGADIEGLTKFNESPLLIAVQSGSIRLVSLLLEYKANVTIRDENGKSISHYAVRQQFIGMLHYLLEKQLFDFNARDKFGKTPLQDSIDKAKYEVAMEIAKYRPFLIQERDHQGSNAIHYCAAKKSFIHLYSM